MLHVYYSISDLLFDKGWTPDIMRFYLPDISLVKASYFFGKARYRVTHKGWDFRDDFRNLYCLFPYICNSFAKSVNKPFKDNIIDKRLKLILKSPDFNGVFKVPKSSLQSHPLWVTLDFICNLINISHKEIFKWKLKKIEKTVKC